MKHLKLGASIYVPATRADIAAIANGEKLSHSRSTIFCTEDSVNQQDLSLALNNIDSMLRSKTKIKEQEKQRLCFIRVRNEQVLGQVLAMADIEKIDGFVLPKVTPANFPNYKNMLTQEHTRGKFLIMPTLETREVFNPLQMQQLCSLFLDPDIHEQIISLRIGGNDLLHLLGLRRSRYRTIYDSPLGATISALVTLFKPNGFNLTAPVCESIRDTQLLCQEVPQDLEYGLFGKTAIHPDQIKFIEQFYKPNEADVEMAYAIVADNAPAVFAMHGVMCEKATHSNWAMETIARAQIYGIYGNTNKVVA